MPGRQPRSRTKAVLTGREQALATVAALGRKVRAGRRRRRWSQRLLGQKVGVTGRRVGQLERGLEAGASLDLWYALAAALDIPLKVELGRDQIEDTADAGHLKIQELVLRLGRQAGYLRAFELPTRPAEPALSTDVHLRDDRRRLLVLNECWNTFGNVNASVRSTRRKLAEAEALAVALGGEAGPYQVAGCWIVRDTRRNRELAARYPEVFASSFTGSSAAWVRALMNSSAAPPTDLGLV
jgi:transcriptional regulator with XRE-family HTH domain